MLDPHIGSRRDAPLFYQVRLVHGFFLWVLPAVQGWTAIANGQPLRLRSRLPQPIHVRAGPTSGPPPEPIPLRVDVTATNTEPIPLRVDVTATNTPTATMWCAPSFRLDSPSKVQVERLNFGTGELAIDSAFVLSDVLSRDEAARMVATADQMGFQRDPGDERERLNGACSWVLHEEMVLELLRRISPHVPLAMYQHSPDRAAPTPSELATLATGVPQWARDSLLVATPWVRECAGAPEGIYTLSGLSARSRVYRYDAGTSDAFLPHYDEVWPGSSLALPDEDGGDESPKMPTLTYDKWKYNSVAEGAWSWSVGDRVSHLSVLLYLNDDFDGGQTVLHAGPRPEEADPAEADPEGGATGGTIDKTAPRGRPVAFTPTSGTALCFAQSFSFGRPGVPHSPDALLHEGMPVIVPPGRPLLARPAAKYVMRTDVCYTMPPPAEMEERGAAEATLNDPQATQQMTVEISSDPETRAKQLALLRSYGYDTSAYGRST